ncbi:hypothetical protein [Flavobacterium sp. CAN_S2]|uniref:hypothetical protein n=1 Tax=Flavobacterium sp. CAN_S2 TaxID=2787726 RepID=UPI0018CAE7F7
MPEKRNIQKVSTISILLDMGLKTKIRKRKGKKLIIGSKMEEYAQNKTTTGNTRYEQAGQLA